MKLRPLKDRKAKAKLFKTLGGHAIRRLWQPNLSDPPYMPFSTLTAILTRDGGPHTTSYGKQYNFPETL